MKMYWKTYIPWGSVQTLAHPKLVMWQCKNKMEKMINHRSSCTWIFGQANWSIRSGCESLVSSANQSIGSPSCSIHHFGLRWTDEPDRNDPEGEIDQKSMALYTFNHSWMVSSRFSHHSGCWRVRCVARTRPFFSMSISGDWNMQTSSNILCFWKVLKDVYVFHVQGYHPASHLHWPLLLSPKV